MTRSRSGRSAASAAPAEEHDGGELVTSQADAAADARLYIRAAASASSAAARSPRRGLPTVRICDARGPLLPATTRVKVILYPLPGPGRGYLALQSQRTRDAAAGHGREAAGGLVGYSAELSKRSADATADAPSVPAAGSGRNVATHAGNAESEPLAAPSPLELAIQRMNSAAAFMAALEPSERPARRQQHDSGWAGIQTAFLCSAAAGGGLYGPTPACRDNQPPATPQLIRLLGRAVRGSALLAEISRRAALIRTGGHAELSHCTW